MGKQVRDLTPPTPAAGLMESRRTTDIDAAETQIAGSVVAGGLLLWKCLEPRDLANAGSTA
ncbi:MAG: HlyD family type I secretion periplasmic adaptor subunit, partial [Alphaproteobacteria bacterium]|nr:HlyD family type I secretion periplasmic adaptor subunit [Alphaproteobacteria bacterium]